MYPNIIYRGIVLGNDNCTFPIGEDSVFNRSEFIVIGANIANPLPAYNEDFDISGSIVLGFNIPASDIRVNSVILGTDSIDAISIGALNGDPPDPLSITIGSNKQTSIFIGGKDFSNGPGGGRITLTENTNFYVANDGNDSNPGTIDEPWETIQNAVNYVCNNYDFNGYTVTINVADGTYNENVIFPGNVGSGQLNILGNVDTPDNVVIQPATGTAFLANAFAPGVILLDGIKIISSGASGICLSALSPLIKFLIGRVDFGIAVLTHIYIVYGTVETVNNYVITGSAARHVYAQNSGTYLNNDKDITIIGTPNFSTAFCDTQTTAKAVFFSNVFTGTATGKRYNATLNSVINTFGAGVNALPGNVAGTTATGGQYA